MPLVCQLASKMRYLTAPWMGLLQHDVWLENARRANAAAAALEAGLGALKAEYGADLVVVNGENAAGGRGITHKIAISLLRAGVTVITHEELRAFGYQTLAEALQGVRGFFLADDRWNNSA